MAQRDRDKWNKRYAEDSYCSETADALLARWIDRIPSGKAVDIACGSGRNALFMAQAGFEVDAIDISREGLNIARKEAQNLGLAISWIEHDLEQSYDFDTDYQLILVTWYVNLALISRLCKCMAPGGYLICKEHMISDRHVAGPRNPDFRVAPGQLRDVVSGLEILHYKESIEANDDGEQVACACVVARKPVYE